MASKLSSRTCLLKFCILPVFVVVCIVIDMFPCLIENFWMTKILVVTSRHILAFLVASVGSYWFLWRWCYGFSQNIRGFNVFFNAMQFIVISCWWPMNEKFQFPSRQKLMCFFSFRWNLLNLMSLKPGVFSKTSWF